MLLPLLLLPNFMFLIPVPPVSAVQTSPNPGQPLPPGTVSFNNTWNATIPTCPKATPSSQPLAPTTSWNKTLGIPTQIFNAVPSKTNITQTFKVTANGSLSVSDNAGNNFSIGLRKGLPSGITTTSLRGNATMAVQTFLARAGPRVLANVTVIYSVNIQSCYPMGLRIEIKGSVSWPAHKGTILIPFNKVPVAFDRSSSADNKSSDASPPMRAYFGNSSGVLLGFDWSDSRALNPTYDPHANAVSYQVNDTFDIDPMTIGTTGWDLSWDYSGQICYASGRTWLFYFNGTQFGFRSTANSSAGWSSWTSMTTSGTKSFGNMAYACSGTLVVYATELYGSNSVYVGNGTMNADGTIHWLPESRFSMYHGIIDRYGFWGGISVALDTAGRVWVAAPTYNSTTLQAYLEVWEAAPTWTNRLTYWGLSGSGYIFAKVVQLSGGAMAVVGWVEGYWVAFFDFWSGSAWLGPHTMTWYGNFYYGSCAPYTSANSSGVACVMAYNYLALFRIGYGATAWPSGVNLGQGYFASIASSWPTKTVAGQTGSTLFVPFNYVHTMSYRSSTDGGVTWTPALKISKESGFICSMTSGDSISPQGLATAAWTAASSCGAPPISLRVSQVPVTVPQAATAAVSWARPGISPYESYFSSLSDYVSPGNGLLSVVQGILSLPGRGIGITPALVYTQPGAFRGGSAWATDNFTLSNLGLGWSLDLPWLGTYYIHLPGGQAIPYQWVSTTNEYHGAVDFSLSTSGGASCPCTLTMANGVQYSFNSLKQLTAETDPNGNAVTFTYGSNGISGATTANGGTVSFGYTGIMLTSITSGGRAWTLSYSGNNLVNVTDPLNRKTTYQYRTANSWLISAVLYPTGGSTTYSYGSAPVGTEVRTYYVTGRTIYYKPGFVSRTDSMRVYVVNGLMVWYNVTENDGFTNQGYVDYHFSSYANIYEDIYHKDKTGAVISIVSNVFDANGRIITTNLESPIRQLLAFTTNAYDNWGNPIYSSKTFGQSNTQQETWLSYANTDSSNSFGTHNPGCTTSFYSNAISSNIHDALVGTCAFQNGPHTTQESTYYEYDYHANLLEQKVSNYSAWLYTDYTHDGYGNVLSAKDPGGHFVYYRYSSAYNYAFLTKQTTLVGVQNITTTYAYDSAKGFLLSVTTPNNQAMLNPTRYTYDLIGRVTSVTYPSIGGVRAFVNYTYDDAANSVKAVDEDGHVAWTSYDGLGRRTDVQRWNGSSIYSTTSYSYNWLNEVATESIQQGPSTFAQYTYTYDSLGRLIQVTNPDGTIRTAHYALGITSSVNAADENGRLTVYTYDGNGRLLSVATHANATAAYTSSSSYDRSGDLLSTTDNNGQVTTYQYDGLNRLVTTTYPDGTTQTLRYNNLGEVKTRVTQNGTTISYTYDQGGRLTKTSYPGGVSVTYTYDKDGNILTIVNPSATDTYAYDARNRLTSATTKIGGTTYTVGYTLDKAGLLTKLTYPDNYALPMTYDALGRLSKVGTFATVSYTLDDQLSKIVFGDGEVQTYAYNSMDRPTSITDSKGGTNYLSLSYTYDNAGNILKVGSDSYGYDWLGRVTSATGGWGTTTYRFDGDGNTLRTTTGGVKNAYTYKSYFGNGAPANSELVSTSSPAVSYTYDGDGNTVSKSGGWVYTYNAEDQMTKATKSGVVMQTDLYDGAGNRVSKTEAHTVVYSYMGVNVLYEKDTTTGVVTKHFYAGGMQVAKVAGAVSYYFHSDQVGSTRLVKDSSLNTKFSSDYTPFGTTSGATGSESFMYTDKPYDSATGLYYSGARFYDPAIGRFTSKDPISSNDYSYAGNNPLSNVDPTGLIGGAFSFGCAWQGSCSSGSNAHLSQGQLLLVGAVALTAFAVAQGGFDPFADALAAANIGGLLGTGAVIGAASLGIPIVVLGTQDAGSADPQIIAAVLGSLQDMEGPLFGLADLDQIWANYNGANDQANWNRLFGPPVEMTNRELGGWRKYWGTMGEDYLFGGSGMGRLDNLEAQFFDEAKVGKVSSLRGSQIENFNAAKAQGLVPRNFYNLLSPAGDIGVTRSALRTIGSLGFQKVVPVEYEWWWDYYS